MAAGSEGDALRGVFGVGVVGVEGGEQARQVHELVGRGEVAGGVDERVCRDRERHAEKDRTGMRV